MFHQMKICWIKKIIIMPYIIAKRFLKKVLWRRTFNDLKEEIIKLNNEILELKKQIEIYEEEKKNVKKKIILKIMK